MSPKPTLVINMTLVALLLAAIDSTAVGTLLPTLGREFGNSLLQSWLITGFIGAQIIVTPIYGRFADRYGLKFSFAASLLLFVLGSIGVIAGRSMAELIGSRVIQGLGAGGIPVLCYTTMAVFSEPDKRAQKQSVVSSVWGLAAIVGPIFGSVAAQTAGWRWVFIVNIPIALFILFFILNFFPKTAEKGDRGLSWEGFRPFIEDVSKRNSWLANFLAGMVLYASITFLPQFMENVAGKTPIASGLAVMFGALGWVAGAIVCGKTVGRFGFRREAAVGGTLLALGSAILAGLTDSSSVASCVLGQGLLGVGMGLVSTCTLVAVQNETSRESLGAATSAIQLARSLGAVFGIIGFSATQALVPAKVAFEAGFFELMICSAIVTWLVRVLPANGISTRAAEAVYEV